MNSSKRGQNLNNSGAVGGHETVCTVLSAGGGSQETIEDMQSHLIKIKKVGQPIVGGQFDFLS